MKCCQVCHSESCSCAEPTPIYRDGELDRLCTALKKEISSLRCRETDSEHEYRLLQDDKESVEICLKKCRAYNDSLREYIAGLEQELSGYRDSQVATAALSQEYRGEADEAKKGADEICKIAIRAVELYREEIASLRARISELDAEIARRDRESPQRLDAGCGAVAAADVASLPRVTTARAVEYVDAWMLCQRCKCPCVRIVDAVDGYRLKCPVCSERWVVEYTHDEGGPYVHLLKAPIVEG